jgi:hypothetical protein
VRLASKDAGRAASLADEVSALQRAVEGAVLLLDGSVAETFEADRRKAAMGVLVLVAARLNLVRLTIRGAANPRLLLGGHNDTVAKPVENEDQDVRLPVDETAGR